MERRFGQHLDVRAMLEDLRAWRVFGGSRTDKLPAVATAPRRGFETTIKAPARAYVAVQALDAKGHPLGRSAVEQVH